MVRRLQDRVEEETIIMCQFFSAIAARQQEQENLQRTRASFDKIWKNEYNYALRQALKRGIALKQAQDLASRSADSLFETGEEER